MYECYGAGVAGSLLTIFGRLFTLYVQLFGLTCGLDDLILNVRLQFLYVSDSLFGKVFFVFFSISFEKF